MHANHPAGRNAPQGDPGGSTDTRLKPEARHDVAEIHREL